VEINVAICGDVKGKMISVQTKYGTSSAFKPAIMRAEQAKELIREIQAVLKQMENS
jgi:hypothetical protein